MKGFLLILAGFTVAVGGGAVWGALDMSPSAPATFRAFALIGGITAFLLGLGLWVLVEKKFGS